ncbi:hypothetical protein [Tetragenococcus halophilus]|uniref:hypothetical protein n=1 Tax=Tetragenococcus halophilus TaxID=51669 RepID=UPI0030F2AE60
MTKKKVYVGGDLLTFGSQMLREWEKQQVENLGFDIHSAKDDKEINDKSNQTVESNNDLPNKIFKKDTDGMVDSDILIFDVANTSVGTTAEIGQWAMIHELCEYTLDPFLTKLASKPIFFHSSDIRDTDIPETGHNRSHSYNAYLVGCCNRCNEKGIQTWDEIIEELKQIV